MSLETDTALLRRLAIVNINTLPPKRDVIEILQNDQLKYIFRFLLQETIHNEDFSSTLREHLKIKDWFSVGRFIYESLCARLGVENLNFEKAVLEDRSQDRREIIKYSIIKFINDTYVKYIRDRNTEERSLTDKLTSLINHRLLPIMLLDERKIIIESTLARELSEYGLKNFYLQELASYFDAEFHTRFAKKNTRTNLNKEELHRM